MMSHNVGAVDVSLNAVPIWSNWAGQLCIDVIGVGATCNSNGYLNTDGNNTHSIGSLTFGLPQGLSVSSAKTVAVFNVVLDNFNTNDSIDGVFLNPIVASANNVRWGLLDVKSFSQGSGSYRVQFTFLAESSGKISSNGYIKIGTSYNNAELAFLKPYERISGGMASFYYLEGSGTSAIVDAINNSSDAGAINSAKDAIVDAINNQQQKEEEATENIENQTPEDMSSSGNTENQASSNLIDLIRSFVSALTSINTGNCDITLDFPSYAGGSRTVNICQNKDKAGNLISVFSSLTLIVFYIPLAFKLLTMIYNEIRSFTNG